MKKKILIVEDYAGVRNFMKFLIESYGHQVLEARNGEQAIELLQREMPDLILMDLSMPMMDGLAATREIRQLNGMANLPIIAITGHANSYQQEAIEAGCDDYINKPIDINILEPVINQYLTA